MERLEECMDRAKRMTKRKFVQICTEKGMDKHIAKELYYHLKITKQIVLANLPSTEGWIRTNAKKAVHSQEKNKT